MSWLQTGAAADQSSSLELLCSGSRRSSTTSFHSHIRPLSSKSSSMSMSCSQTPVEQQPELFELTRVFEHHPCTNPMDKAGNSQ